MKSTTMAGAPSSLTDATQRSQAKPSFEIITARHYGMCFGVKAAIKTAQSLAEKKPVTILGELAHNPTVQQSLTERGALHSKLENPTAETEEVIITAHGAADKDRARWREKYRVTDTTCPLVHRAHDALRGLVEQGFQPIVIGKAGHVEVNGLVGDFPETHIILTEHDARLLPYAERYGVIAQTTQQIDHVENIVSEIKRRHPSAEVRFIDTVCRPTKDRQQAMLDLCQEVELVIVVGGKNSNNTQQLARKAIALGCLAHHIQTPKDIKKAWFRGISKVGVTAGTSTPDSDVDEILHYLHGIGGEISCV